MPRLVANHGGLFDQATGQWIGVVNVLGQEQVVLTPAERANLTATGALSGVTYDTGNRAVTWTIDGVNYTASYSTSEIVVAGSDGTIRRIALDPAQRIIGVTAE